MKKRVFALLLSAALCFSLIGTASAVFIDESGGNGMITNETTKPDPDPKPSGNGGSSSNTPSGESSSSGLHSVASPSVTGGTVTASPSSNVGVGQRVTLTVTPDSGYELESISVVNVNGTELKLTNEGGGKYSFLMVDSDVTVKVTFRSTGATAPETPATSFVDVAAGAYYYDAVLWAVENGITTGKTSTTFAPGDSCTRAQAVTFLWRAKGEPEPTNTVNPFTDVDASQYYYKAVLWAVENGVTTGTGDGTTFSPNDVVNRGQMVTFMWRAEGKPAVSASTSFTDVDGSAYYAAAVQWANSNAVVQGMGDGTFAPGSNCTRGQIVTMLYRNRAQ